VVEVKKKKVESFESLLRRFHKKIQQSGLLIQRRKIQYSGLLIQRRKIQYYEKPMNRGKQKSVALRKLELKKQREYLRKTGKLKDEYSKRRSFLK